jgi:hypothetical protein
MESKLDNTVFFYFFCIVGGGIKVHSALRPLNGLLCQPRVIMIMEKSVGAGETEVLGENLPQCARTRTRAAAVGSQRLTASATARPLTTVFTLQHCVGVSLPDPLIYTISAIPPAMLAAVLANM